jgi:hypothetical protein
MRSIVMLYVRCAVRSLYSAILHDVHREGPRLARLPVRFSLEDVDDAGDLCKVRTFDRIETIGGHPTPLRLKMDTVPAGTSSTLTLSGVTYTDVA